MRLISKIKQQLIASAQLALLVPALALGVGLAVVGPGSTGVQAADDCTSDFSGGIGGGANCAKGQGQSDNLFGDDGIFKTITNVLLFIIGAIAVIMLIIGGIRYVVSAGDQAAVTGAKNTILYSVVGIIVALLAYAVVNFVVAAFVDN